MTSNKKEIAIRAITFGTAGPEDLNIHTHMQKLQDAARLDGGMVLFTMADRIDMSRPEGIAYINSVLALLHVNHVALATKHELHLLVVDRAARRRVEEESIYRFVPNFPKDQVKFLTYSVEEGWR